MMSSRTGEQGARVSCAVLSSWAISAILRWFTFRFPLMVILPAGGNADAAAGRPEPPGMLSEAYCL